MGTTLLGHALVEDRYYLFTEVAGEAHIDLLPHNAQSATLNIFSIRLLPYLNLRREHQLRQRW